jgi:hypothetical protein
MATGLEQIAEAQSGAPVRLDWTNRDGNIVITPSDKDRFVLKVGAAIEILRRHSQVDRTQQQFSLLLKRLAQWLDDHQSSWETAFLTSGEGVLRFIVVRKTARFDEATSDALSALELDIARDPDLDLVKLTTTALPSVGEESLRSFLDPAFTLKYGVGTRSHQSGQ